MNRLAINIRSSCVLFWVVTAVPALFQCLQSNSTAQPSPHVSSRSSAAPGQHACGSPPRTSISHGLRAMRCYLACFYDLIPPLLLPRLPPIPASQPRTHRTERCGAPTVSVCCRHSPWLCCTPPTPPHTLLCPKQPVSLQKMRCSWRLALAAGVNCLQHWLLLSTADVAAAGKQRKLAEVVVLTAGLG